MKPWFRRLALIVVSAVVCTAAGVAQDGASWRNEEAAWRAQHAVELQKPDGWLALAALEWLQPGENSFGSAADNKIHLPASGPEHLVVCG